MPSGTDRAKITDSIEVHVGGGAPGPDPDAKGPDPDQWTSEDERSEEDFDPGDGGVKGPSAVEWGQEQTVPAAPPAEPEPDDTITGEVKGPDPKVWGKQPTPDSG